MIPAEVETALKSMVLLIDTREQPTESFKHRIEQTGLPSRRQKLFAGDYSCECLLPDGGKLDFSGVVAIERKMDLDELCLCFGKERSRFEAEFERAHDHGIKIYLLVEGASWEAIYAGKYRSKLTPAALQASIDAWRARYGMQVDFCREQTSGKRIRDILYRELKEYLLNLDL